MGNIIGEKKNLDKRTIVYSGIATILMFIIMGNLSLITMLCKGTSELSKIYVLGKGFSLSILDIELLYMTLGYFTYMILKKKKFILRNYIKAKIKSESVLVEELKFISKVVFIAVVSNLIIKTLLYFIFRGSLISSFNIGVAHLLLSLIYMTLVTFILYLLVVISYVSIRDFFSGTFVYCLIFGVLNLVLGTGTLFISEKISFVQNILSLIYNIYNVIIIPFYDFSYVYTFNMLTNIGVIFALSIISLSMIYILKNSIRGLNKKNIKEFYINNKFRKLFYLSISITLGYFIFLIGFILLISFSLVSYDTGLLIINLVQVASAILIYFKLDELYLRKHLKGKKSNKELNVNKTINNKEIVEKTLIFKPTNLENELDDREKIKDFSFDELDEYLINEEKIDDVLDNKDERLKNEVFSNKEIEIDADNEKLIDFLREDNVIKSKN